MHTKSPNPRLSLPSKEPLPPKESHFLGVTVSLPVTWPPAFCSAETGAASPDHVPPVVGPRTQLPHGIRDRERASDPALEKEQAGLVQLETDCGCHSGDNT